MAKHLEVSLYRNARSFEAYTNMSTLKQRLHQIAAEVSRKARPSAADSSSRRMGSSERSYSSSNQNGMNGGATSPYMSNMSSGGSSRMVNMEDINPMSNSNGPPPPQQQGGYRPQQRNDRMPPQQQPPQQQQQQPPQRSSSQNRNDPEWKMRIRHKQQRLLLLHHSAKCPQKGQCTVTPHCADMKKLWRHMEGCKDNHCRVPHCFSSRAILSHYRKCKDPECPACGPVRETVRKAQGSRSGGGSNTPSSSTGPLMNSMRSSGMSSQQQQSQSMVTPSDSTMGMSVGSFGSSMSHQRSSPHSHAGMPPPVSGSTGGNSMQQYSSSSTANQYRPNGSASTSQGSVQPLYRSDQPNKDSRSQASTASSTTAKESMTLPASTRPAGSSESEWQKIRHKQQRLLLLRHASRCQHEAGTCPVTPHCASMKKLWEHIAHCKNQQCKVQHCLSSRYVLSHYRRCKNTRCPSCGPVRDSIRRSTAREKRQQQGGSSSSSSAMPSFDGGNNKFHAPPLPPQSESSQPDSASPQEYQPNRKKLKVEDTRPVTSSSDTVSMSNTAEGKPEKKEEVIPATVSSKKAASAAAKPSGDHSLLNSFSFKEIETHLESLDRKTQLPPAKLKAKCTEVLKGLQSHQHGWVFNCPVDPVELGLPDYFEIIKKPMDLGTVQKKLDSGGFHEIKEFETLVHLTFDNAMTYNENGSVVYGMAKELKIKFEADMKKLMEQLEEEDMQRRQNERACMLCGCEKLLFEPPVYFCNGMNCQSQRIRRNNNFYIGGNNQYFWCNQCFNELDEKTPIELVDMTIKKGDLVKKRNDEVHEESWVQCDTCERWVHQICGLFNTRQNKEHHSEYCCPRCLRDKRKGKPEKTYPSPPGASDLPRTALSEWLEKHITDRVEKRKRELAEEKAASEVSLWFDGLRFLLLLNQNS